MEDQYIKCLLCEWTGLKKTLKGHKRWSHRLSEDEYQCGTCKKKFKRPSYLARHNSNIHLQIKHPCDKCDYKATRAHTLRTHKKSIHEGKRVPCTQCEHKAFDIGSLSTHMKSVHLGDKSHTCDKCDFKTSTKTVLKRHVVRRHTLLEKSLKCTECSFTTSFNKDLGPINTEWT